MNPFQDKKSFVNALKMMKPSNAKQQEESQSKRENMEIQCNNCEKNMRFSDLMDNNYVCPLCGYHFKVPAPYRIKTIADAGSFHEICASLIANNPLDFPDYGEKTIENRKKLGIREAVMTGTCKIEGIKAVLCVMDNRFFMGSMGTAVGEKITRSVEYATKKKLPLIIISTSGGARMQEGILSLFQMAKTSAAIEKHSRAGQLYISVLTNPTTGGVTASFASLGDVILAEPGALIGFAGPRVIEQTIKETLPEGFQRAEYLLEHGFVDKVVERKDLRKDLGMLLRLYQRRKSIW